LKPSIRPTRLFYDGKIIDHAHNDYLETLAETGIAGGLCAPVYRLASRCRLRSLQEPNISFASALRLAGLTGCCGVLVHSLVDFNLHIPANATFSSLWPFSPVLR